MLYQATDVVTQKWTEQVIVFDTKEECPEFVGKVQQIKEWASKLRVGTDEEAHQHSTSNRFYYKRQCLLLLIC